MTVSMQNLADLVKGGVDESSPAQTVTDFWRNCTAVANDLGVQWFIDSGVSSAQAANIVRGSVITRINRGVEVAAIGAARGYLLPNDPLPKIEAYNRYRRLFEALKVGSTREHEAVAKAVTALVKIADAYDAGTITFDRTSPAAQVSSFDVSVDGMSSQSGNPLADILGYQPDGDFIKRKRAIDALARLDFSKRKTYMLFTADVITEGKRQNGTVVCWMKMRDASGYNIRKRDVFKIIDYPQINLSGEFLEKSTKELLSDRHFQQVLSFYDWVQPDDVYAFVDDATGSDTLYSYAVSGVQRRAPTNGFIFDVQMNALYLSSAQAEQVRMLIQQDLARFGLSNDIDSVSPYPALAQVVYGDPGYGWILAGCNVLASTRRGDTVDQTRAMSYIGSKSSVVLAAVSEGRMFVPADVNEIHRAVDDAVRSFGVSQTVLTVLDGAGVTMFSTGKDDPLGIKPTQESLERATGGLAKILAAIDPETASVDPKALAAALAVRSPADEGPRYASTQIRSDITVLTLDGSQPEQRVAPPAIEQIIGQDIIDLTTYDGLARLMQLLRMIYDFYPGALS